MAGLRLRFARWVLAHRRQMLLGFALVTVFFAAGLPRVQLRTIFSDLLPRDDPFVQVYKDHPDFGSPLMVMLMIRRVDGDIYDFDTLRKVWQLTRDIDLVPGVDHEQILSITTEKARYSEATPFGIDMRPLMDGRPPQTAAELEALRRRVDHAPNVAEFLISRDEQATVVMATFIEHQVDYGVVFDHVQRLAAAARDTHHEVYVAGQPILIGWVYRHEWQMVGIFAVTLAVLVLALFVYMRNAVGVLTPILTSAVAAIWAFGLVGWLGIPIEPLLMIIPLLLTARSFSHSVQFTERYYELYAIAGDRSKAAEATMNVMLVPSVLSILTDALGIVVVVAAPIPAMVHHAIFCGMWALFLIPTGCVLISLLLATLPPPGNVERFTARGHAPVLQARFDGALRRVAGLAQGRIAPVTTAVVLCAAIAAVYTASQIRIGNPVEGTNLLWPDSPYNVAVRAINANFPGMNTLEIVFESKDPDSEAWTAVSVESVQSMQRLQALMESGSTPPRKTLSFADYLAESNRLFRGGDPRWLPLDPRERSIHAAAIGAMMGSSAKNFTHIIDPGLQNATVSLWYPDNRQGTVDAALRAARAAVAQIGVEHAEFRIRLGTGTIALQEAINRVIERYQWLVIAMVNLFVFVLASLAFRSMIAGLILIVPVNLAHHVMIATMHLLGVGLDVNSLIVAAAGVGIGIDYGIYLLSRICEELRRSGEWPSAITAALRTTGRAILFTGAIMAIGIAPWYALSGLKFVADMGLLLIAIMFFNMLLALLVLPLMLHWLRPSFALHGNDVIGESGGSAEAGRPV